MNGRTDEPGKAAELARRLAAREWDLLWALTRDLPLAAAVDVMRRFDARWRPPAEDGRALFDLLAVARPRQVTGGRKALMVRRIARIKYPGRITECTLSDDGTQLIVGTTRGGRRDECVSVYRLPGGRLRDRFWPSEIHYRYHSDYQRHPSADALHELDYGLRLPAIPPRPPRPARAQRIADLRGLLRDKSRQLTRVSDASPWISRDGRYRILRLTDESMKEFSFFYPATSGMRPGRAEVFDDRCPDLLALVDRPMADWRPGDSRIVGEVPADITGQPGVQVLLRLASASLEYRFGAAAA